MTKYPDDQVGAVADALANSRRRAVITRLCRGSATTTELAEHTGTALPTMHQHLNVLRTAGLVASTKQGRVVNHTVDLAPLAVIDDWVATRRSFWSNQLDALAESFS